mmetsp:Transcript_8290/g.15448  ORF Transcript_8290/g.15448 Transcript_8290/m.15448 type:complete len:119 (-) Transcript_8290:38-394(-)
MRGTQRSAHVSDKAIMLGGEAAKSFLLLNREYWGNPSQELDTAQFIEDYLRILAQVLGLKWQVVTHAWLPHFLSVHVQVQEGPPEFCLRGISRRLLVQPVSDCVHPSLVPYRSCDDDV